jgi:hypothetical protein
VNGGERLRVASRDNDLCAFSTQEFGGGQANAGRAAGDEDGFIFHNQVDAVVCRQKRPWHSFSSPFLLSFLVKPSSPCLFVRQDSAPDPPEKL